MEDHMKASKWRCELHDIYCNYGSPCYECVKEMRDPDIIEITARGESQDILRKKNSVKRYKVD